MPKQILLVDDSVTIHRVVEITFAREDYRVTAVKSADEALARAKDLKPDVVLADAGMPGKTGYELCAALKADGATSAIPVVILTGNFNPYDEVKGQKAGVDAHIVKPFETQAMIDKIGEIIKKGARQATTAPSTSAAPPPPAPQRTPAPAPAPQRIEPLSKPLSVVAQETRAKEDFVEIDVSRPAPAPAPVPQARPPVPQPPRPAPAVAKTMMGYAAPTPAPTPVQPPPAAPPPPAAAAPQPTVGSVSGPLPKAPSAMPQNVPQMPRPSMIPGAPTPQVARAAPAPAPVPAKPSAPPPRATLMGIPAVNPASLGPGAVPLPTPAAPKPAAWAPPSAPAAPESAKREPAPSRAEPAPAQQDHFDEQATSVRSVEPVVSAVVDRAQQQIAARGPEYEAIAKLSREVIEKIAWEVVPELAETIIKEQLDRLVRERGK